MKIWENIVIGSGPGGATSAITLAENGAEVLILEEGVSFTPDESRAYTIDDMKFKYRDGGVTASFGKPKVAYVEGSLMGGGSEVNAGLYHRTPPEILEKWTDKSGFACQSLSSSVLNPHFEYCESALSIGLLENPPPASLKLKQGADALGWKCIEAPRWILNNERQSMSRTFLPQALALGASLETNIRINKFEKASDGWKVIADSKEFLCKNLFVCAGSIYTPSLMMKSGIRHNIGKSLQMHPSIKMVAEFAETVNAPNMPIAVHQVKEYAPTISIGCSISTPPYLGIGLIDHLDALEHLQDDWKKMAIYYAMIVPEGRGQVLNIPFQTSPLVTFKLTTADLENIKRGYIAMGQVLFAAGAKKIYGSIAHSKAITDIKQIENIDIKSLRNFARLMTIHLFSSCPMGENKKNTATNSFGKVWDHENLYINDASLLCSAPGVNPQGSVMAIARRNIYHHLGKD